MKCNPNEIVDNWDNVKDVVLNCNDIMLSMDGLESTNDFIRNTGSFKKTLNAIKCLKENNQLVRLHFTASKNNCNEIVPLLNFLFQEGFILDDFTWGRYWSNTDLKNILTEDDLISIFEKNIEFLNSVFCNRSFFYFNECNHLVPRIFFSFKEHLWIPFFIENNILSPEVAKYILSKKNCINCTATKDIYIVDQDLKIYNCRKINVSNNDLKSFFSSQQNKLDFPNFLCNNCFYTNVCKSCFAIPKTTCKYFKRRDV